MKYLFLAFAIVFEVVGSSFLKASNGFSKLIPTTITIVAYIASFYFFSQALKTINLGVAYAIWGGLGIVLTAVISVVIFKQSLDIPAIIGISLIIAGVLVMNFFSKSAVY
ncbi:DMT family transporter [Aequorivita marina]|uniref:DMT family transporter n=1 Tax=Aequorivita marina TaxID=3073654 RepID=UPI002875FE12|nr:multidrug efflux SMR transporter [Aequorivita sp. S2608]MDS1299408.1 multidrug efflux SMR transporter [Aequorivita sp. S2608]